MKTRPKISFLEITGFDERKIPNTFLTQPDAQGVAVIYPGSRYTCQMPLLYFSTELLLAMGYDVLHVNYGYEDSFFDEAPGTIAKWLHGDAEGALKAAFDAGDYQNLVILGKSLGTRAMAALYENSSHLLPMKTKLVWLTPMLKERSLLTTMTAVEHPSLLIAGTDDQEHFDSSAIHVIQKNPRAETLVLKGGDHTLSAPENDENRNTKSHKLIQDYLNRLGKFIQAENTPASGTLKKTLH